MVRKLTTLILAAVFIGLTGCTQGGGGPTTWLDQPLDNTKLPLARTQIMAHASDDSGVASFEFFIDKDPLVSVKAGGGKFGEALVEWEPKAPGEYTVRVHAVNGAGNSGPDAISVVTVGEMAGLPITVTPSITPVALAEISDTPVPVAAGTTVTITVTISPTTEKGLKVVANQNANCRYGPSTAYQSVGFLLKGQHAPIVGRNSYGDWFVINLPGKTVSCWVSGVAVDVTGDTGQVAVVIPPELIISDTPEEEEPITEPEEPIITPPTIEQMIIIPIDTIPPVISNLQASPNLILMQGPGCPTYSRVTLVSAAVSDEGGLGSVVANWSLAGQQGQNAMSPAGGGIYQASFGPLSTVGELSITVSAQDTAGNSATAGPVTVQVQNCIE